MQVHVHTCVVQVNAFGCKSNLVNIIHLLFLQQILQGDVDELSENSDNAIPHCKISIKWTGREDQLWQTEFTRDVMFMGSTAPKVFVIDFHPSEGSINKGKLV